MFYYRFLRRNTLTPDDVITFVLNKMRRNLIKIRSCAFFSWFNWFYRFVLICRSVNVLVFRLENVTRFHWLIHGV